MSERIWHGVIVQGVFVRGICQGGICPAGICSRTDEDISKNRSHLLL